MRVIYVCVCFLQVFFLGGVPGSLLSLLLCFSCFYAFLFFSFPAFLLLCFSCFPASLLFCFFAFPASLLFCFHCFSALPASLLLCFLLFLLLCFSCFSACLLLRFSALCFPYFFAFLLLCCACFSASLPLCLSTSTILLFFHSCVIAALLPAPLLLCVLSLQSLCFSCSFVVCSPVCILNETLETLRETYRNPKKILIRNPTWNPKRTLKKP